MTRIITIANQKGGVGKTTTTVNIAAAMAQVGKTVLVIDMDPQGNATTALGIEHSEGTPGIYNVLMGEVSLAEVITPCLDVPQLFGIPATIDLAGAEVELVSTPNREHRLREEIEKLLRTAHFDYIFLDCPPSLGLLTLNGLVAAREVLLPIQCEYYALEGLSQLLKTVDMIKEHLNPELYVAAIILTMYDGRTRLASQVADEVRNHFGARVLETIIPRNVRVSEAPSYGQTVLTYDPASAGSVSYREAAAQLDSIQ